MDTKDYSNITENEAIALIKPTSNNNYYKEWFNYHKLPDRLKKDVEFNIRAINETQIPLVFLKEQQIIKK